MKGCEEFHIPWKPPELKSINTEGEYAATLCGNLSVSHKEESDIGLQPPLHLGVVDYLCCAFKDEDERPRLYIYSYNKTYE